VGESFATDRTRSHVWDDVAASGPRLVVLWEGGSAVTPLQPGRTVVIGRGDECEVQVLHGSVSRRHVELSFGPPLAVRDLGSSNGTRVAGRTLLGGDAVPLAFGVAVEIGAAMAVVQPAPEQVRDGTASPATGMDQVRQLTKLVAPTTIPVLLLGETGVGKEVTAAAIHAASPRSSGPLVRVNCASLTEALLESELFGHERGAFTGALTSKSGLVEEAHGGTLFLDEVAELAVALQAKLLHVLEDREVRRVGATRGRAVDVRFIAATNQDLPTMVERGAFRADLYFRLNGVAIRIPPLRERTDEILGLAETFLAAAHARLGAVPKGLPAETVGALTAYGWPGNVRELRNVVERAVLLAGAGVVEPRHLVFEQRSPASMPPGPSTAEALPAQVERLERERIERALMETGGNQTLAAKMLGITRRQLIGRLEAYDLPRPRKRGAPGQ
jgi:transcriptional regulator with PAS, ATPase and Fis domain